MQTEWNRSIKTLRNSLFPVNFIFYSELFQFLCILVEGYQYRSSRPDVLFKKVVLKGLSKFIGKHLCQSLFFNKVAGLRPATKIKKGNMTQVFSCEFCQILKYAFFKGHLRWLPLSIANPRSFTESLVLYFLHQMFSLDVFRRTYLLEFSWQAII